MCKQSPQAAHTSANHKFRGLHEPVSFDHLLEDTERGQVLSLLVPFYYKGQTQVSGQQGPQGEV